MGSSLVEESTLHVLSNKGDLQAVIQILNTRLIPVV